MPVMLYERTKTEGEVVIRARFAYYLVRYSLFAVLIGMIFAEDAIKSSTPAGTFLGLLAGLIVLLKIISGWEVRKELSAAMKSGTLQVSGSAWNYKHPLRYAFRGAPAQAKTASRG